jgi:hypothetical protein
MTGGWTLRGQKSEDVEQRWGEEQGDVGITVERWIGEGMRRKVQEKRNDHLNMRERNNLNYDC